MAESRSATETEASPVAATEEISEFESLLNREFKPKSDTAREAVQTAVRTLAEHALAVRRSSARMR